MTSDAWITASHLCRYYQRGTYEVRAVDHVTLGIARGDFVAVVGASGSGKSTLLNLLAGLDTPTSGEIRVGAQSLTAMSRRDLAAYRARHVGIIFQSFNLLPHQTALRNVETAMLFNGVNKVERRRRAGQMLDRLGIADRADHRPADLSGGEQQRVAIARALVKEPDIIFADEPTGNLDHDNTESIASLLTSLNRDGMTIIMVTHDLDLARRTAQRSIRMVYGKIDAGDARGTA
ncbi:MAG: ABC transporter ATP-binding protein [Candidatus Zixiibacteriota bacterium]